MAWPGHRRARCQPIVAGDDNSVTFYANLSSNPNSAQKRAIRYVAAEKRFYQDIYNGTGTFPNLTFPASPSTSVELLRPVTQANEKVGTTYVVRPIFIALVLGWLWRIALLGGRIVAVLRGEPDSEL